jgi:hypothetical protein
MALDTNALDAADREVRRRADAADPTDAQILGALRTRDARDAARYAVIGAGYTC